MLKSSILCDISENVSVVSFLRKRTFRGFYGCEILVKFLRVLNDNRTALCIGEHNQSEVP